MTLIILSILCLLLGLFSFYLFNQLKKEQQSIRVLNQEKMDLNNKFNFINEEKISLATTLQLLEKRIEEEKEKANVAEKVLKEQLTLITKNIVQEGSLQLRSENQAQLQQILQPFKERIEKFESEIKQANEKGSDKLTTLETTIKNLTEQHQKINTTAQNLADALKGNQKTQGDWGELALERLLEMSGLEKGREYDTQLNFKDENNNNQRPDVIIQLPEDKHIIIDAKVSLVAFERYINEEDEPSKSAHLQAHILSVKTHVKQLSDKNYTHLKNINSPEFVLLFIPIESSFAIAMKQEPELYQFAWEKRIVLVTPSTLLATLKTVESIWKQERRNKYAIDIADQAGKLYDKFVGFVADLETIGKKQNDANSAYQDAMKKLQLGPGNLITQTEKLKEMGAKAKKSLASKYIDNNED